MEFNGLHVNTEASIAPISEIRQDSFSEDPVFDSTKIYAGQSSKLKFDNYNEVATKKSFKDLLESREIDFEAVCLCFQYKLRNLFKLAAMVEFI